MSNTKVKKIYVKPVIESEEFVANEYVAACYSVTCLGKEDNQSYKCDWGQIGATVTDKTVDSEIEFLEKYFSKKENNDGSFEYVHLHKKGNGDTKIISTSNIINASV